MDESNKEYDIEPDIISDKAKDISDDTSDKGDIADKEKESLDG